MGITLIIVMGMLAFIINVGLFVKAKINLQNATDAAAFAGAATQARQLTNIAYVNWEMRNTYKEWMFKYYVLGQLGLMPYNLSDAKVSAADAAIDFTLPTPPISGMVNAWDKYNVPSICIHNNSATNICPIFALPGIPRFPAIGVAGISEIHEAFVDKLVEEKGVDCSRRSKANYLTALTWAYGSGTSAMPEAPLVVTNRPGAWPQALELAMRIRNLEMILNRPPVADMTRANIDQFQGKSEDIGLNERPMKAFWSAYRNLGGGVYKDNITGGGGAIDELPYNLKLTELSPRPLQVEPGSVSGFLITPKPDFTYPGGSSALEKHYVDLQLMPMNFATMFSTFVDTSVNNAGMDGVLMEASCGVSKTALPVPGYIMGFNKNPKVLTYYAVKAESKFIGLFFPIFSGNSQNGVKLTAYAAAKPFGGRIGPKLFSYDSDPSQQSVTARPDLDRKSAPYTSGMALSAVTFSSGMPIPFKDFWVQSPGDAIGGVPQAGRNILYAVPNMIYDFTDGNYEDNMAKQTVGSTPVQVITEAPKPPGVATNPPRLGLYHSPQFKALKAALGTVAPGTSMSGEQVLKAIIRARRPTKYDAINYLIPDFREITDKNNAAPMVQRLEAIAGVGYSYKLFAPLVGPSLLYKSAADVEVNVNTYINANEAAVDTYLAALLNVASGILLEPGSGDKTGAARSIHAKAGPGGSARPDDLIDAPAGDPGCKTDMASKFYHFFSKEQDRCGIVPLKKLMVDFIAARSSTPESSLYYASEYYYETGSPLLLRPEQLMTAYFPGSRQGTTSGDRGIAEHPLNVSSAGNPSYSTRRNFYSTKFFHMAKAIESPPGAGSSASDYDREPALREKVGEASADIVGKAKIENYLQYDALTGIDNLYYLDF